MKKSFLYLSLVLPLFILSSFIVANQSNSVAKEELPGATIIKIPYFDAGFLCNGEFAVVEGVWTIVSNVHADGNGGFHVVDNWSIKASGVGDFGNEYRLNWADNFQVNVGSDDLPFTRTLSRNFNVIGKGQAPNLKFWAVFHITVNKNGEVTADVVHEKVSCK